MSDSLLLRREQFDAVTNAMQSGEHVPIEYDRIFSILRAVGRRILPEGISPRELIEVTGDELDSLVPTSARNPEAAKDFLTLLVITNAGLSFTPVSEEYSFQATQAWEEQRGISTNPPTSE